MGCFSKVEHGRNTQRDFKRVSPEPLYMGEKRKDNPNTAEKIQLERLGIYYSNLIPVLIKAIQEQQKQIEELQQKLGQ